LGTREKSELPDTKLWVKNRTGGGGGGGGGGGWTIFYRKAEGDPKHLVVKSRPCKRENKAKWGNS